MAIPSLDWMAWVAECEAIRRHAEPVGGPGDDAADRGSAQSGEIGRVPEEISRERPVDGCTRRFDRLGCPPVSAPPPPITHGGVKHAAGTAHPSKRPGAYGARVSPGAEAGAGTTPKHPSRPPASVAPPPPGGQVPASR